MSKNYFIKKCFLATILQNDRVQRSLDGLHKINWFIVAKNLKFMDIIEFFTLRLHNSNHSELHVNLFCVTKKI